VPIDELWLGDDAGDPGWRELVDELARRGTRIVRVSAGASRATAGVHALVLAAPTFADAARSANDASLVLRVDFAGRSMLFPGDLEAPGEAALVDETALAVDVVKAPHHGSRTSSTAAFVAATHPRVVVISCGWGNRFGFPAPEVVARWQAAGADVHRTDQAGAVTVRITPKGTLSAHNFQQ
jgi:competence protein ComEC